MKVSFVIFSLLFVFALCSEEGGIPVSPLPRFTCNPYEVEPDEPAPTNVNQLAPHNIDVIMSMGDSMTAAFAATAGKLLSTPLIPREDRYLSYTAGGGSMQYTVNNFLKLYNKNILGYSSGQTLPIDGLEIFGHHIDPQLKEIVGLNAGISGAKVQDIPQEIDYLVSQLQTTYADTIDFENSWKMATILIGANNLCVACHNNTADSPETYGQLLNSSIAQLEASIPRVRVNILPMFNITQVYYWSRTNTYCTRIWDLFEECPCLTKDSTEQDLQTVNDYAVEYRKQIDNIAAYWQSKNSSTFTVSVQPITESLKIINGALTSDFDCFHPSELAHAWLGSVIWNSIWLPADQKPTNATELMINGLEFVCPDRHTYMQ